MTSRWCSFQGADPPREERREHPVPAGGQQVGPGRQAPRAAGRVPRARAALAGALRRDQRQDQGQRRQGTTTCPPYLLCYRGRPESIDIPYISLVSLVTYKRIQVLLTFYTRLKYSSKKYF